MQTAALLGSYLGEATRDLLSGRRLPGARAIENRVIRWAELALPRWGVYPELDATIPRGWGTCRRPEEEAHGYG